MTNENDLLQKLMVSKKIMDRHSEIPRSGASGGINMNENYSPSPMSSPEVESYEPFNSSYNIPDEYSQTSVSSISQKPLLVTEDRIKSSKLPDAIKKLMLENPIQQPQQYTATLSNDIIEKAAKLMSENKNNPEPQQKNQKPTQQTNGDLKKMVKEAVEEILRENGLITESETKSQETFQFRVGKHIFEGKIMKVKKLS